MISRAVIDKELADLRDLFDRALEMNVLVFDATMRLHGIPLDQRRENIAAEYSIQMKRRATMLAEIDAVLSGQDAHTKH